MNCKNCGVEISDGQRFCPDCGTPTAVTEPVVSGQTYEPQNQTLQPAQEQPSQEYQNPMQRLVQEGNYEQPSQSPVMEQNPYEQPQMQNPYGQPSYPQQTQSWQSPQNPAMGNPYGQNPYPQQTQGWQPQSNVNPNVNFNQQQQMGQQWGNPTMQQNPFTQQYPQQKPTKMRNPMSVSSKRTLILGGVFANILLIIGIIVAIFFTSTVDIKSTIYSTKEWVRRDVVSGDDGKGHLDVYEMFDEDELEDLLIDALSKTEVGKHLDKGTLAMTAELGFSECFDYKIEDNGEFSNGDTAIIEITIDKEKFEKAFGKSPRQEEIKIKYKVEGLS